MSVVLPIETDDRFRKYTASAGQTVFAVPFPFQDNADIAALLQNATTGDYAEISSTLYTLTGAGNASGGSLAFLTGRAEDEVILILGRAVLERLSSVVRDGAFSSKLIDGELDRNRIIQQELARELERSVKVEFGNAPPIFPAPEAGKVVGWSQSDKLANFLPVEPGTVLFGALGETLAGSMTEEEAQGVIGLPSGDAGRQVLEKGPVTDIIDLLHPLKSFAADPTVSDEARFTALRALWPERTFDLDWGYYRVDEIPDGPFERGWFVKSNGAPVTPADICYPAEGTLLGDQMTISAGARYAGWTQGGMHGFGGRISFKFNEGSDHIATDHHVRIARSADGGLSVREFERAFQSLTVSSTCWAFGECDGQEIAVVRENDPPTAHRLMVRPLADRRTVTATIVTTAGGNGVQILIPNHGRRSGNKFKVKSNIVIDGLTIVGGTEYSVTNGTPSRFYFNTGVGSATAGVSESHTFVIEFIGSATWTEILFGGASLGAAIQAFGVHTSLPAMVHGCEAISQSGGIVIFGCQGGGKGDCMVEVTGILGNAPAIAKVVEVGTAARVEPTFRRAGNGDRFMLGRTQAADNSPEFAFSVDGGVTWTSFINGPRETFQYSPFDFRIVDDTYIVAFCSGNRGGIPDIGAGYARAFVDGYILVGEIAALKAQGWPAFRIHYIGNLFHFNNILFEEVNVVGVGSMLIFQDYICLTYSADSWDDAASATSDGEVYFARIHLGNFLPQYRRNRQQVIGQGALGSSRGGPPSTDMAWIERVVGSTTFSAWAVFDCSPSGAGAKRRGFGLTCTRHGIGDYTFTIVGAKAIVAYLPIVVLLGAGDRRMNITSIAAGGFKVNVFGYNSTTPLDCDVGIAILTLEDFARSGWAT